MFLATSLYACVACLQTAGAQAIAFPALQSEQRVLQPIPIDELLSRPQEPRPPLLGSFLGTDDERTGQSVLSYSDRSSISADVVAELVLHHLGAAIDEEGTFVDVHGSTLIAAGQPSVVDRARGMVRHLADHLARPIRVTATLYRVDKASTPVATAPRGWLDDPGQRGLAPLWQATGITRSGYPIALTQERFTRFVRDVDVEVAQRADVGDPKVQAMFEGVRVVVDPHALAGSEDFVVYSQLAFGERRGQMQVRATGMRDYPSLDVPLVESNCAAMSARIGDGGAILFSSLGSPAGGSRMVLAVTATWARPAQNQLRQIGIYPVTALTADVLSKWVFSGEPSNTGDIDSVLPLHTRALARRGFGSLDTGELVELLRNVIADRIDDNSAAMELVGGHLVVFGDEDVQSKVLGTLQSFQTQWLRTAQVVATTEITPIGDEPGVFSRSEGLSSERTTLHELCFPALLGRPHFAMRGLESTAIQDLDVEIAERSEASNPVVVPTFSGLCCSVLPYPLQDGVGARLAIEVADVAPLLRRPVETKTGGDLYLPETARSGFSQDGPLPTDAAMELGQGPIVTLQGARWQTSQKVRVRLP